VITAAQSAELRKIEVVSQVIGHVRGAVRGCREAWSILGLSDAARLEFDDAAGNLELILVRLVERVT
jgi:hypothetical protein